MACQHWDLVLGARHDPLAVVATSELVIVWI